MTKYSHPAVVVDVNSENGLASARALGREGIATTGLSASRDGLGLFSRWCTGQVCPDATTDPEGFVDFLHQLGESFDQKAVLIVSGDAHLEAIGPRWDRLTSNFLPTFPSWDRLEPILDKEVQLRAAQSVGVGTPRSVSVEDPETTSFEDLDLGWPALIKGRVGKGFARQARSQVVIVDDPAAARKVSRSFADHPHVIQEIIPGDDEQLFTYGSYRSHSGEITAEFGGRKLRQHPVQFGGAICAESVDDEQLLQDGRTLLEAMDFVGPSQVEFKLDARDGRYKLIEVNARLWRWHGLATHCGVNLALAAYRDAVGDAPPAQCVRPTKGGRWLYSFYDVPCTGKRVVSRNYPLRKWFRTSRPPAVDAVFALDDPKPYFVGARNLIPYRGLPRRGASLTR